MATVLFIPKQDGLFNFEYLTPLNLILEPGDYAIVFGSAQFGADLDDIEGIRFLVKGIVD